MKKMGENIILAIVLIAFQGEVHGNQPIDYADLVAQVGDSLLNLWERGLMFREKALENLKLLSKEGSGQPGPPQPPGPPGKDATSTMVQEPSGPPEQLDQGLVGNKKGAEGPEGLKVPPEPNGDNGSPGNPVNLSKRGEPGPYVPMNDSGDQGKRGSLEPGQPETNRSKEDPHAKEKDQIEQPPLGDPWGAAGKKENKGDFGPDRLVSRTGDSGKQGSEWNKGESGKSRNPRSPEPKRKPSLKRTVGQEGSGKGDASEPGPNEQMGQPRNPEPKGDKET